MRTINLLASGLFLALLCLLFYLGSLLVHFLCVRHGVS